jgi:PPOX class probable F420-dependent enzyme
VDEGPRRFVAAARVGRLATVSPGGAPHVVPVCFVLDGDDIYVALDEKPKRVAPERLRRVRNIRANPRVQLLADVYDEDWSRLAFVQADGRATLVQPGGPGHARAIALLREKYPQYRDMALETRPVIAIVVERWRSWSASGA